MLLFSLQQAARKMTNDERWLHNLNPEMATLDCGTCNFGGDEIFVNTENMIIDLLRR